VKRQDVLAFNTYIFADLQKLILALCIIPLTLIIFDGHENMDVCVRYKMSLQTQP